MSARGHGIETNMDTPFFVAVDRWTSATAEVLGAGLVLCSGDQSDDVVETEMFRTMALARAQLMCTIAAAGEAARENAVFGLRALAEQLRYLADQIDDEEAAP